MRFGYEMKKPQRPIFSPLKRQYFRRCTVSLPGSGWFWVVPVRSCHGCFHSFSLPPALVVLTISGFSC
jgi:hypothetical protein